MVKQPLSHLFKQISRLPAAKQVEALQQCGDSVVRSVLNYAYNPQIKFLLPEGPTPFDPLKDGTNDDPGLLYGEIRRLYLFIDGGNPNLKPANRERLWIELLKYVHQDDAALLDQVKDKGIVGIKASTVKKAFPDLF